MESTHKTLCSETWAPIENVSGFELELSEAEYIFWCSAREIVHHTSWKKRKKQTQKF